MDFAVLPVNAMLNQSISKLDHALLPPGYRGDARSLRLMQASLSNVINRLGEESSKAQGLNKVVTNTKRFRNSEDQLLYLLKDPEAQGGKGDLIGLLKVGWKHLFLFDEAQKVHEVDCLCVLDFFIVPDRQRHGNGKILFDHMLEDLKAEPKALAIDGPSPKMEEFLRKNYGVTRLIRQNNNFAISPEFFTTTDTSKSGRRTPAATAVVGRFTAPKPKSSIASVIHGGGESVLEEDRTPTKGSEIGNSEITAAVKVPEAELQQSLATVDVEETNQPSPIRSSERPSSLTVQAVSKTPSVSPRSPAKNVGATPTGRECQLTDRGTPTKGSEIGNSEITAAVKVPEAELQQSLATVDVEETNQPSPIRSSERPSSLTVQAVSKTPSVSPRSPAKNVGATPTGRECQLTDRGTPTKGSEIGNSEITAAVKVPEAELQQSLATVDVEETNQPSPIRSSERPSSLTVQAVSKTPSVSPRSPAKNVGATPTGRECQLTDRGTPTKGSEIGNSEITAAVKVPEAELQQSLATVDVEETNQPSPIRSSERPSSLTVQAVSKTPSVSPRSPAKNVGATPTGRECQLTDRGTPTKGSEIGNSEITAAVKVPEAELQQSLATVDVEETNQPSPIRSSERPSSLTVQAVSKTPSVSPRSPAKNVGATPTGRECQLTDRGYVDIKYYHSKLW